MQNLNLEFNHEEIKQADFLLKFQNKTDKQILFICIEDYPQINGSLPQGWSKHARIVILKKGEDIPKLKESHDIIDINQSKSLLQNQILKIFKSFRDSGVKEEVEETLSDREKIIMRELVLGFTNKEIADRLFISPHTVIAHRKNITGKLGIKSVPGLTIYAILHKIINEDDIKRAAQPSDSDTHK